MNGFSPRFALFPLLLLFFLSGRCQSGFYLDWAFPHTLSTPIAPAIAPDGSIWLTGKYFNHYTDLNRHPDTTLYLPEPKTAATDGYLVRFDSTGWYQEHLVMRGNGADEITFTGFDASGGMVVLGKVADSLNISLTATPFWLDVSETSFFLARYAPDRQVLWAHTWKAGNMYPLQCAVGTDGSFYFTGGVTGGAYDLDFTAGTELITPNAYGDMLMARYRPDGSRAWAYALNPLSGSSRIKAVAVSDSSVWACGQYYFSAQGADSARIGGKALWVAGNNVSTPFAVQIGANGIVNQFFSPLPVANYTAEGIAVGPGGETWIVTTPMNSFTTDGYLHRYRPDGTLIASNRHRGSQTSRARELCYLARTNRFYLIGDISEWYFPDTTISISQSFPGIFGRIWELDTAGVPLATKAGERVAHLHAGFGSLYFTGDFVYSTTVDQLTPPYLLQLNTSTTSYPFLGRFSSICQSMTYVDQPVDTLRNCETQVALNLRATGTGLRYQWYEKGSPMDDYIGGGGGTSILRMGTRSPWMRSSVTITGNTFGYTEGYYHCVAQDGCGTTPQSSDTTWRYLYFSPYLAGANDVLAVNAGDTLRYFLNTPGYPSEVLRYQWLKGNFALFDGGRFSGTSTATLQILNARPSDQGLYYCITYNRYCEGFYPAYALVVNVNGTTGLDASHSLTLFPNPAHGHIFTETDGSFSPVSASLIAPDGRIYSLDMQEEGSFLMLSLPDVPAGVYGIRIEGRTTVRTGKIVID